MPMARGLLATPIEAKGIEVLLEARDAPPSTADARRSASS